MKPIIRCSILAITGCLLVQPAAYGSSLRWSGFGSMVMGKATNQESLPGGASSTFKPDAGVSDSSSSCLLYTS
ncbi:MAG: hypothetical protein KUG73_08545, partial [Pseudomonadales bacterium]|nr:hypothetical protein [Pseudomonadales bacterium]